MRTKMVGTHADWMFYARHTQEQVDWLHRYAFEVEGMAPCGVSESRLRPASGLHEKIVAFLVKSFRLGAEPWAGQRCRV